MVSAVSAQDPLHRYRIAFACVSEDPGVKLEGFGFSCAEVRRSFELAARSLPVELTFYDNRGDRGIAVSNIDDAIRKGTELFIEYDPDPVVNAEAGARLKAAGIPALAINYPVPGAPLYGADNAAAGSITAGALAQFAAANWRGAVTVAVIVGGATAADSTEARASGVSTGLRRAMPGIGITRLEGGSVERLERSLNAFLTAQRGKKILVAALDDRSALSAKEVIETAGRVDDCVIVSQGLDRSMHGGMHEKREISPDNRASIVLGAVAFYLDRYGYDVLPLALRILRGESVPAKTSTRHMLVTSANIFREYPPTDLN
jgi:ABC-type sugar transport system substrate-binding protein